jgi:hypothetical protein
MLFLRRSQILIIFLLLIINLFSQSRTPNFISFKENSWAIFNVFDSIDGKLKNVGYLKYDRNYNNIILYLSNNKIDTIKKIINPFSLTELLFEVKYKHNKFFEIYTDSLKDRKLLILNNKNIKHYSPKKLLLKNTFFIYTKNKYNNTIYTKPDLTSEIHSDSTRFNCFQIKEVKNQWIKVITTDGDPCGNYQENGINSGWIKWYDNGQILLGIERW